MIFSFDEKCLELARYFHPNEPDQMLRVLAQEFQDAAENFLPELRSDLQELLRDVQEAAEKSAGSIPAADLSGIAAAPAERVSDRMTEPRLFKLTLAGRCANGFERDHGRVVHAVPSTHPSGPGSNSKALCGAKPGRRSAGWSAYDSDAVTCPRCISKMTSSGR